METYQIMREKLVVRVPDSDDEMDHFKEVEDVAIYVNEDVYNEIESSNIRLWLIINQKKEIFTSLLPNVLSLRKWYELALLNHTSLNML